MKRAHLHDLGAALMGLGIIASCCAWPVGVAMVLTGAVLFLVAAVKD